MPAYIHRFWSRAGQVSIADGLAGNAIGDARAARLPILSAIAPQRSQGQQIAKTRELLQCQPCGGSVRRPVQAKTLTLFD